LDSVDTSSVARVERRVKEVETARRATRARATTTVDETEARDGAMEARMASHASQSEGLFRG